MESTEEQNLPKDLSSYSSFYKTKLSIYQDKSDLNSTNLGDKSGETVDKASNDTGQTDGTATTIGGLNNYNQFKDGAEQGAPDDNTKDNISSSERKINTEHNQENRKGAEESCNTPLHIDTHTMDTPSGNIKLQTSDASGSLLEDIKDAEEIKYNNGQLDNTVDEEQPTSKSFRTIPNGETKMTAINISSKQLTAKEKDDVNVKSNYSRKSSDVNSTIEREKSSEGANVNNEISQNNTHVERDKGIEHDVTENEASTIRIGSERTKEMKDDSCLEIRKDSIDDPIEHGTKIVMSSKEQEKQHVLDASETRQTSRSQTFDSPVSLSVPDETLNLHSPLSETEQQCHEEQLVVDARVTVGEQTVNETDFINGVYPSKKEIQGRQRDEHEINENINGHEEYSHRMTENIYHTDDSRDEITFQDEENISDQAPKLEHEHGINISAKYTDKTGEMTSPVLQEKGYASTVHDNIFFTGRLPTLLSRGNTAESISKQQNEEQVPEDEIKPSPKEANPTLKQNDKSDLIDEKSTSVDQMREGRTIPAESEKIRKLIKEINAPAQLYHFSRESPIASRNKVRFTKSAKYSRTPSDAIMEVEKENVPAKFTDTYADKMTVADINKVTSKVMRTTHVEEYRSKFEDLPQMKTIDVYLRETLQSREKTLESVETTSVEQKDGQIEKEDIKDISQKRGEHAKTEKDSYVTAKKENSDNTTKYHDSPGISNRSPQHSPRKANSYIKFTDTPTPTADNVYHIDSYAQQHTTTVPASKQIQRSSSENDLKEIIASAKMAIGSETDISGSQLVHDISELTAFSVHGDNFSISKRHPSSRSFSDKRRGVWGTPDIKDIQTDSLTSLICSKCLQVDPNIHTAGFCTKCQQYLCETCITVHTVENATRLHTILPSYCKNEIEINKYVLATGYCVDCTAFLCSGCAVKHSAFRANRHHRIVQSSFVSKQQERKKVNESFLDEVQEKMELDDSKPSSKSSPRRKRKRKIPKRNGSSYPYQMPYNQVPESLYPGPKKTLAISYVQNPKWAHSSIPNLPYLVQPKPIPDPVNHHVPFESQKHPTLYVNPTKYVDMMTAKLKMLKSRYKVKDTVRSHRKREINAYTARPLKTHDNTSLPDIKSLHSQTTGGRSLKHIPELRVKTNAVRKCEFIAEYCLTIPFPRGEDKTEISAMSILSNGKLAVLDKRNNNIKLFNTKFHCTAALQFHNRLIDLTASNLCPTDIYTATPKHLYELSAGKGMELTRKMKMEIKRIEGLACWKYGLAIVCKKTSISWELRLMDYRGNAKSKLEIFNPFELDIASTKLCHVTASRNGKCISLSDSKNSCVITVDVLSRVVMHETGLDGKIPSYLTSDGEGEHNIYVTCDKQVLQISRKGKVIGVLIDKTTENQRLGCIVFNKMNNRLYVQNGKDTMCVYQII